MLKFPKKKSQVLLVVLHSKWVVVHTAMFSLRPGQRKSQLPGLLGFGCGLLGFGFGLLGFGLGGLHCKK